VKLVRRRSADTEILGLLGRVTLEVAPQLFSSSSRPATVRGVLMEPSKPDSNHSRDH